MVINSGATEISELLCEYVENPIGIDMEKPRFTWKISSERITVASSRFRIIVSSSETNLLNHFGDMWDSGYVYSIKDLSAEYSGRALKSGCRYFWRVSYKDYDGKETFSDKVFFEMGLLKASDWQGNWLQAPFKYSNPLFKKGLKAKSMGIK
jgi:alpha-L-rhamnosidase